jgi:hypothetical protein
MPPAYGHLDNPKNIVGMSRLLDKNMIPDDFNLEMLEREITSTLRMQESDPMEAINAEIDRLAHDPAEPEEPAQHAPQTKSSRDDESVASDPRVTFGRMSERPEPYRPTFEPSEPAFRDPQLRSMTHEERQRGVVDSILSRDTADVADFNAEKSIEEDNKLIMVEQIDELWKVLEEDGVDMRIMTRPSRSSTYKEIEDIYRILLVKSDRRRYGSFAEELILGGAQLLEGAFNGKREYFGYRPDLTGWQDTVKVRLRRMRFETSKIVGDVFTNLEIGPWSRLALELIPSAFLHMNMRSRQFGESLNQQHAEHTPAEMSAVISDIVDHAPQRQPYSASYSGPAPAPYRPQMQ